MYRSEPRLQCTVPEYLSTHLFKWIADNGYTPSDNPRESHIDGIWNKESDSDSLTKVQVPIVKIAKTKTTPGGVILVSII